MCPALPLQEWLARASQRAEQLDNTPGLALTGEPLIALQRRLVSLVRSQPLCGALVRPMRAGKKVPAQLEPLPDPLLVAVDGTGFHLLTLERLPFGGGGEGEGAGSGILAAVHASSTIGEGNAAASLHALSPLGKAGPGAYGGTACGTPAVSGAGAAAALSSHPLCSSLHALRSGAMPRRRRVVHSLPFRCMRRWGYSAAGSFHMDLMMELVDDQLGPVDDVLRSGSVAHLELLCLEGQAVIARELEACMTGTVKVRVDAAGALGIDAMSWKRPRGGPG